MMNGNRTFVRLSLVCTLGLSFWSGSFQKLLAEPQAMLISDFEADDFGAWVVQGDAFGSSPVDGSLADQPALIGGHGRVANSFHGGAKATGELVSEVFVIDQPFINVRLAGGTHSGSVGHYDKTTAAMLMVNPQAGADRSGDLNRVVRVAIGEGSPRLDWMSWDVRDYQGQRARVVIRDHVKSDYPTETSWIVVDQIEQSDSPRQDGWRDWALARAHRGVERLVPRAAKGPTRPVYHVRPAAAWLNDPNGAYYKDGYYHVFYQLHPFGGWWDNMHWGHVRSRDLVHWEHMPIALWPSHESGEQHIFSGGAAINNNGTPLLFYTSVAPLEGRGRGLEYRPRYIMIAEPDDAAGERWRKVDAVNPLINQTTGSPIIGQDPFVFKHQGRAYMVTSEGSYLATDVSLTKWRELPDLHIVSGICPVLFSEGDRVIAIQSKSYVVGRIDADAGRFHAQNRGRPSYGGWELVTTGLKGPKDRNILFSWICRRQPYDKPGRGWSGYVSLPRVVSIGEDGAIRQHPPHEVKKLRREHATLAPRMLADEVVALDEVAGDAMEIKVTLRPKNSEAVYGLQVRRSADAEQAVTIRCDAKTMRATGPVENNTPAPLHPGEDGTVTLRIFLDKASMEIFNGDGRVYAPYFLHSSPDDVGVALFAEGAPVELVAFDAWQLKPIWKSPR